jgi:hypothetical protein
LLLSGSIYPQIQTDTSSCISYRPLWAGRRVSAWALVTWRDDSAELELTLSVRLHRAPQFQGPCRDGYVPH